MTHLAIPHHALKPAPERRNTAEILADAVDLFELAVEDVCVCHEVFEALCGCQLVSCGEGEWRRGMRAYGGYFVNEPLALRLEEGVVWAGHCGVQAVDAMGDGVEDAFDRVRDPDMTLYQDYVLLLMSAGSNPRGSRRFRVALCSSHCGGGSTIERCICATASKVV
jgi:hypothetical protein